MGKFAGLRARANHRAGRDFDPSPPAQVTGSAVKEWLLAFQTAFDADGATEGNGRVLSGFREKKKRKRRAQPEVKTGQEGLRTADAQKALSSVLYKHVLTNFSVPEDDGAADVKAKLREEEYVFTEGEWDEFWASSGRATARSRAKSARYTLVKQVKSALFYRHGTHSLHSTSSPLTH